MRPRLTHVLIALAAVLAPAIAVADPGLGGLGAIAALYLLLGGVLLGGIVIAVPGLIRAFQTRREADEGAPRRRGAIILAIIYLVLASPMFFWALMYPKLHWFFYSILLVYIPALAATLHYFVDNKRFAIVLAGALFAFALFRTPEIVSYRSYDIVDNWPLEYDTVELAEQHDDEYIRLADGRTFLVTDRFWGWNDNEKLDRDRPVAFEPSGVAAADDAYSVYGVRKSQDYYQYETHTVDPLFTIPLRTITIERNMLHRMGKVRLLDDDWTADHRVLHRAVYRYCCNLEWILKLLERGADATQIGYKDMTFLHGLSRQQPFGDDFEAMAAALIEAGVDIDATDDDGKTAVFVALEFVIRDAFRESDLKESNYSYVQMLLENGADPNIADDRGKTPILQTVPRHDRLTRLLLDHGADPLEQNGDGHSALERAEYWLAEQKAALNDDEEARLERLIEDIRAQD